MSHSVSCRLTADAVIVTETAIIPANKAAASFFHLPFFIHFSSFLRAFPKDEKIKYTYVYIIDRLYKKTIDISYEF